MTVKKLDESLSRIKPKLYYLIFIFCDIFALTLQAVGGAVSTVSSGSNAAGVDLALTGLIFQVVTMLAFVGLLADYLIRYFRGKPAASVSMPLKLFLGSLSVAVLLILVRCAYRVAEREFLSAYLSLPRIISALFLFFQFPQVLEDEILSADKLWGCCYS